MSPLRTAVVAAYVLLALAPLAVALAPPLPRGRPFGVELSLAVGFVGFAQIALQFALIARFERISRPFGIDRVMQVHRQMGFLALALVLVHAALLLARAPDPLRLLALHWTGASSLLAAALLVVLSAFRQRLRLGYEAWRVSHALLALAALGLGALHVARAGAYFDAPWKRAALVAWCVAAAGLLAHLRLARPLLMGRRPWRVIEVRPDAAETWSVVLEPVGHAGLRFAPGQFAWLKVGSPWTTDEHPFSFSSSAEAPARLELGVKELGDFTRGIGRLEPGTRAFLDGPHGSFTIDDHPAAGYLFVAGGIGISPILSMLRTLADGCDRRSHVLVYACSRWDRVAFRAEIERLARRLDLRVVHVLEHPPEGWSGATGYVGRELLQGLAGADRVERHAFVCGPDAMMAAVERALRECGLPASRIHMERFDIV